MEHLKMKMTHVDKENNMNTLNGLKNFLEFINENWTTIIVIIGLILAIVKKAKGYFSKSDTEKIAIAKAQIQEVVLKMISDAETDYSEWNKAGSIKRAQVIKQIFLEYPILSKMTNQEELISWIDDAIDNSLKTLRKIVENQPHTSV